MAISLVPMVQQPIEMWRCKRVGSLDIRYVAIFTASAAFSTIYAVGSGVWVLMIINPSVFVILAITALLWVRYRSLPPKPA
jgi:uncharacterized protein with PQ loop repeat